MYFEPRLNLRDIFMEAGSLVSVSMIGLWNNRGQLLCCCLVAKSCLTLFAAPWTVALQAPLSIGFSGQEYWSGLPFPYPGDLPTQKSNHVSCTADRFSTTEPPGKLKLIEYRSSLANHLTIYLPRITILGAQWVFT